MPPAVVGIRTCKADKPNSAVSRGPLVGLSGHGGDPRAPSTATLARRRQVRGASHAITARHFGVAQPARHIAGVEHPRPAATHRYAAAPSKHVRAALGLPVLGLCARVAGAISTPRPSSQRQRRCRSTRLVDDTRISRLARCPLSKCQPTPPPQIRPSHGGPNATRNDRRSRFPPRSSADRATAIPTVRARAAPHADGTPCGSWRSKAFSCPKPPSDWDYRSAESSACSKRKRTGER